MGEKFELSQGRKELYLGCVVKRLNEIGSLDDSPDKFSMIVG